MLGRVPAYTDISHFRAPYKNAYVSGFGQDEDPIVAFLAVDKTGTTRLRPDAQAQFIAALNQQVAVDPGPGQAAKDQDQVNIVPQGLFDGTGVNAAQWAGDKHAQGKVVFADRPTAIAILTGTSTVSGMGSLFAFDQGSEEAKQSKAIGMVVIAGTPGEEGSGLSTALLVGGAAALLGVGFLLMRGKKKRSGGGGRISEARFKI